MTLRIYTKLKNKGVDVYFPGQHKGKCKSPYVVVRKDAQLTFAGTNKLGQRLVDIMVYCPVDSFKVAEDYVKSIREHMGGFDFLRKTGFETSWMVEDDIEAYFTSLQYTIIKELEG